MTIYDRNTFVAYCRLMQILSYMNTLCCSSGVLKFYTTNFRKFSAELFRKSTVIFPEKFRGNFRTHNPSYSTLRVLNSLLCQKQKGFQRTIKAVFVNEQIFIAQYVVSELEAQYSGTLA